MLETTVAPYGIQMQLTPTMHGAILQVTFPSNNLYNTMGKHICFTSAEYQNQGNNKITGRATQVHHDRMLITNFNLYIHIESAEAVRTIEGNDMHCFRYSHQATVVTVKMATSLISREQAQLNYNTEVGSKSYIEVYTSAKSIWHK